MEETPVSKHTGLPAKKKVLFLSSLVVLVGVILLVVVPVTGNWFQASLFNPPKALTKDDCFKEKRDRAKTGSGSLSAPCSQILYGNSETPAPTDLVTSAPDRPNPFPAEQTSRPNLFPTSGTNSPVVATAVGVATSGPLNTNSNSVQCQATGNKCLNDGACCSGNCAMNGEIDGGPGIQMGSCGCSARPACLDANPPCEIMERSDECVCGNKTCDKGENQFNCGVDCKPTAGLPTCESCLKQGLPYLSYSTDGQKSICLGALNPSDGFMQKDCRATATTAPTSSMSCDYAAPPQGCHYVVPSHPDPTILCNLILKCDDGIDEPEATPTQCDTAKKCAAAPQGCGYMADPSDPCGCGKLVDMNSCSTTNSIPPHVSCAACTSTEESNATCAEKNSAYICGGGLQGKNFCSNTDQTTPHDPGTVISDGIVCKKTVKTEPRACLEEGKKCDNANCCGDMKCEPDYIPEPGVNYFRAPINICQKPKTTTAGCNRCIQEGSSYLCTSMAGDYCSKKDESSDPETDGPSCMKCTDTTPTSSPSRCHYSAPRAGCIYVPGRDYDKETDCGKVEQCPDSTKIPVPTEIFCTQDVKQCPDGKLVSRNPGRGCAFDDCASPTPAPMRCGGNMQNAPKCPDGYRCAPDPQNARMPSGDVYVTGDVGGICIPTISQPSPGSLSCNAICSQNSDCASGYCYQPPFFCPPGRVCTQVMPQRVCRSSPNPDDVNCSNATPPPPVVCGPMKGDLNCDGKVDIADLAKLAHFLTHSDIKLTPQQLDNADIDNNHRVNLTDLIQLLAKVNPSAVQ